MPWVGLLFDVVVGTVCAAYRPTVLELGRAPCQRDDRTASDGSTVTRSMIEGNP
jgi:hypothetical protein